MFWTVVFALLFVFVGVPFLFVSLATVHAVWSIVTAAPRPLPPGAWSNDDPA
jgi:hypothetical protein